MLILLSLPTGRVQTDSAGNIWWVSADPRKPRELLSDADSLCGLSFLNTGMNDPLRGACEWHDKAYRNRAFFELRGWDRYSIDAYFHELCLQIAGDDVRLIRRAKEYNTIVRMLGWIVYYRHPGYSVGPKIRQADNSFVDGEDMNRECRTKIEEYIKEGLCQEMSAS